ncbi:MAG: SUMF1/EgtB/PvdO family nonheme iron enzyme, partial [Treponema sp.]|nr:SUMF1/EgtB/PvdO family nonheme iron enzyme [Treponema sp.]
LDLYLPVLAESDAEEAKEIIASIKTDEMSAYLTAIRIAIKEKDLATAERKVLEAERIWPESSIVKCHKVLYWLALYREFESDEWLNKTAELVQNLGEATSRVELTWQVKVQCMVSEAMGEDAIEFDKEVCKENQLHYGIMQSDPLLTFEEIEEYLNLVDMVEVEGGTMKLGSDDEDDDNPIHTANIKLFNIGKYPVTQEEWSEIMLDNPSRFKGNMRPVERVTWYDAIEFCNELSENAGLECAYEISDIERKYDKDTDYSHITDATVEWNKDVDGFRLPTCDEWEFAARGGNKSRKYKYAGSDDWDEVAWNHDNSNEETHAVGQKKCNELGIYDMSGNVGEWCWDSFGDNCRCDRGGGYDCYNDCRVSNNNHYYADFRFGSMGFRIVRSAD